MGATKELLKEKRGRRALCVSRNKRTLVRKKHDDKVESKRSTFRNKVRELGGRFEKEKQTTSGDNDVRKRRGDATSGQGTRGGDNTRRAPQKEKYQR